MFKGTGLFTHQACYPASIQNYESVYSRCLFQIPVMVNGAIAKRNITAGNVIGRLLMFNRRSEKIAAHLVSDEGPPEQDNSEYKNPLL